MSRPHKQPAEHNGKIMPLDIQSPITRIRMLKGLTQVEIGIVLNVSETVIASLETGGCKMTERVQEGLTELGLDGPLLTKEQDEFTVKKREWLLKHLKDSL